MPRRSEAQARWHLNEPVAAGAPLSMRANVGLVYLPQEDRRPRSQEGAPTCLVGPRRRLASTSCRDPTQSTAQSLGHDPRHVLARQPRLVVGEGDDTFSPRAGHARDVRAPEHSPRAERVVDRVIAVLQADEGKPIRHVLWAPVVLIATFGCFASASTCGRLANAASSRLPLRTPK